MEKFQQVIFKLAETHPNAPLTPAARTLLQDRLTRFVSQYKTPDHPPYSAMIERAIRELNEKRGSSEESISRFLEKEYTSLPWAHSTILKHHLSNLCDSGDILSTRSKRYKLAGATRIPIIDPPTTENSKNRKPMRKKTIWRWERSKRKLKLIKLRIKQNGKIVNGIKKPRELHDENERRIIEGNGTIHSDQETVPSGITRERSEIRRPENSKPPGLGSSPVESSQQREIAPSEIIHSRPEISKPPCFELTRIDSVPNWSPAQLEPASVEEFLDYELPEGHRRLEILDPPDSELARFENSSNSGPAQIEPASVEELVVSERACRQTRRWSRIRPEPKAVIKANVESVHSNPQTPQNSNRISLEQENDLNSIKNHEPKKYSRKRRRKSKESETIVSLALANEKEPQELLQQPPPQILQEKKQPRRSVRLCHLAKPGVTEDVSYVIALPSQQKCTKTVFEHQSETLRQNPVNQHANILPTKPVDNDMVTMSPDKPHARRRGRPPKRLCEGPLKSLTG